MSQELPDDAIVLNGPWSKVLAPLLVALMIAIAGGMASSYLQTKTNSERLERVVTRLESTVRENELNSVKSRLDRMDKRLIYIQRYVTSQDGPNMEIPSIPNDQ